MRVDRELMRGAGPVAVLKLLDGGPKYGYELIESLAQALGWRAGHGPFHPLSAALQPGSPGADSRPMARRGFATAAQVYALTAKGKKRLAHDVGQWRAVADAMRGLGILQPAPA